MVYLIKHELVVSNFFEFYAQLVKKKIIHTDEFKLADMAMWNLHIKPASRLHTPGYQFCTIKPVACAKVEIHIKGCIFQIGSMYFCCNLMLINFLDPVTEDAQFFVIERICKIGQWISAYLLIRIPFPTQCMVNKNGVVFDTCNATMRIGFVALIERTEAFTGEIAAGAEDEVAVLNLRLKRINGIKTTLCYC